jgi:hypothetical protein
MGLVAYAGRESSPEDDRGSEKRERAYRLFNRGRDTLEIADIMNIRESTALRYINIARSRERGLPDPYERKE